MAHSHSRTLLTKMGFGDPDLKNTRHDLACNYIGLNKEVLTATLQAAMPEGVTVEDATADLEFIVTKGEGKYSTTVGFVDVLATYTATLPFYVREPSAPPSPGNVRDMLLNEALVGHPTLGHLVGREGPVPRDLSRELGDWFSENMPKVEPFVRDRLRTEHARWKEALKKITPKTAFVVGRIRSVIEVKIQRVSVGDLIRQLRLYNEHTESLVSGPAVRLPGEWRSNPVAQFWCSTEQDEAKARFRPALQRVTIVCLDYPIDDAYADALTSAGITPVRLGAGFDRFVESTNKNAKPRDVPEI